MKIELNNFYNMDCMEGMKDIPDKYFDLAIVDPPYGIGNFIPQNLAKKGVKISEEVTWNDSIPQTDYFEELKRISKNQIIWGANYYNCFNNLGGALIWHKGIINPIFSQCEVASLSFQKRVDYVHINWQSGFARTIKEGKVIHPCQKPIALYEWLLNNYAKQGDKILDTHVGSASSLIACYNLGFDYVGFELDEDYYKMACKRLEARKNQMDIFHIEGDVK